MSDLPQEIKRAIEALVPLVVDDGPLHKTNSLPTLLYETPFHLNYLCSLMTDQSFPKLERLRVIHRKVRLYTAPFSTIKRFKSWKGKTVGWRLDFIDPLRRLCYGSLHWALTRDEEQICERWWNYVANVIFHSTDFCWYNGDGTTMLCGRFKHTYASKKNYEDAIQVAVDALQNAGFEVERTNVCLAPKEGVVCK